MAVAVTGAVVWDDPAANMRGQDSEIGGTLPPWAY